MWRSCPLLIIISCLLWGRENSHLSLPANQPVSPVQVAKCVHSWDRLIKWGRFLTRSPSWGTLSSLSPSSTLDSLKGTRAPVWCDLLLTLEAGMEGSAAFCGEIQKQQIPFCLKAESGNSLICSNGVPQLCSCSPLVSAMPRGPLSVNNKSGHLTAGHFTAAALTHTSSPGSSLPNLPGLDTKTVACYSEIAL